MMIRILGNFEFLVLSVIAQLPVDQAYGFEIVRRLEMISDTPVNVGAVYTATTRLKTKGYVTGSWSNPQPIRGGRRKLLLRITPAGTAAIEATKAHFQRAV
jgi:DNA-binding PadR family transcriptional regulator